MLVKHLANNPAALSAHAEIRQQALILIELPFATFVHSITKQKSYRRKSIGFLLCITVNQYVAKIKL